MSQDKIVQETSRRYAVLQCAEDSEYVRMKYGGYFGVFKGLLREEGEVWDVYKVTCGEFPIEEEIDLFDGFVVTGSCSDAHGNDPWILKLLILLKKLDSMKKKVLGICFGHQILARAIGGRTGRNNAGWDIGIRSINLSSSSKLSSSLNLPASIPIIEVHQDEVQELPAKAEAIAWSGKTSIEMFRFENHIMGIQGHPEYNKDILLHLIDRLVKRQFISGSYGEDMKAKLVGLEPDRETWRQLCTKFLKGRL